MPLRDPHLQCGIGHVRVDLRRGDAAVAEEALDVADVDALLQEVGGYRVAEHVGGDTVADGGALAVEAHRAADHLGAEIAGGCGSRTARHSRNQNVDAGQGATSTAPSSAFGTFSPS